MDNFRLRLYTDIVFGKGVEAQAGKKIREYGGTKVMLVYGGGSIKRSGLYDIVIKSLQEEGLPFIELSGVKANPLLSVVYQGIETAKQEGVDFFLAVGGGSAIDTAKGIALGMAYDGDVWDFYSKKRVPTQMYPVGVIHTISAAGSETSRSTVLVRDKDHFKSGNMGENNRPIFALMNPEWTYTLPAFQTAAGAADIIAHVFERYFFPHDSYLGDQFSEGVMRTVIRYAPIAIQEPKNYEARAELMLAGAFAHNDIAGIGNRDKLQDGNCHRLEAQMSGNFDTTHGAGLAVVMPAWLEYVAQRGDHAQLVNFAVNVFGVENNPADSLGVALEGARRFRKWLTGIGMPATLTELGIPKDKLPELLEKAAPKDGATVGTHFPLGAQDFERIYNMVL